MCPAENLVEISDRVIEKYSSAIAAKLIEAIKQDKHIPSTQPLSFSGIKDGLSGVCRTIVEAVISPDLGEIELERHLAVDRDDRGKEHGYTRSVQNFKQEELVREFYLLKGIIIVELKPLLLSYKPEEMIDKITSIDLVINQVMESSFQSFAKERKRQLGILQQQLFLTNQELTRLIADRQDNFSYLVHEIKNPLTSIIGYSDLFIRQQKNASIGNLEHIHQVLHQGRKVLRLVNDTTQLSSYKKDDFKLKVERVDICTLIENITIGLKSSIEAKNLKLIVSCIPQRLIINSDPLRIQQIITNLLINAIRYTDAGEIELACYISGDRQLEIKVADTGIGILQSDLKHIFEPYFRGQKSAENAVEGVGLGLAIVAQLIDALNGKIELESEVNVGSVFAVTIPLDS